MTKKLYVGNLPYTVTEDELNELFGAYGTVESVAIINDRETGRSKGFGFVEMSSPEEATAAMAGTNGSQLGGRTLKVDEARPPRQRDDRPRRNW